MKITGISPIILTANADAAIATFEALGFVRCHEQDVVNAGDVKDVTLKNAEGFVVDVASVPGMKRDNTIIRMNVDDFDEAYQMLQGYGFTNVRGGQPVETKNARSVMLVSPSGYAFDLCQHIK